jgi:hypothetical protein
MRVEGQRAAETQHYGPILYLIIRRIIGPIWRTMQTDSAPPRPCSSFSIYLFIRACTHRDELIYK